MVLGARDDLILQGAAQIAEIVAIAGDPHDQVPMLQRAGLGRAQGGSVHNVELDVMTAQPKVRSHQVHQIVQVLLRT